MPLQNRVDPFGMLHAVAERGSIMGNRGGKFHSAGRDLTTRRWQTRSWIICVCDFKNRRRDVWGNGYTELFFLDEVTALSAGHRPCFKCQREKATGFLKAARAFHGSHDTSRFMAPELDRALHAQRRASSRLPSQRRLLDDLPDGTIVEWSEAAWAIRGTNMLLWSFGGYCRSIERPPGQLVTVLTPPITVCALEDYQPEFHASAIAALRPRLAFPL